MKLYNNYKKIYINTVLNTIPKGEKEKKFKKDLTKLMVTQLILFIIFLLFIKINVLISIIVIAIMILHISLLYTKPSRVLKREKYNLAKSFPIFFVSFCNFHYENKSPLNTLIHTTEYVSNVYLKQKLIKLILNLDEIGDIAIERKISPLQAEIQILNEFVEEIGTSQSAMFLQLYQFLLEYGYDQDLINDIKSALELDQELIIKQKASEEIGKIQMISINTITPLVILFLGGVIILMNNIFNDIGI